MFDQLTPNVMVCVEGKIKEKVKKMKKRIVSGLEVTGGPGRRDRVRMHCVSRESRHKREQDSVNIQKIGEEARLGVPWTSSHDMLLSRSFDVFGLPLRSKAVTLGYQRIRGSRRWPGKW